jgi:hypothetical protein
MPVGRATPFALVFELAAQASFPAIHSALARSGQDPRDRDAFLLVREVLLLLRELRPEEGLGEGIDRLAALVHHAYLFWNAGSITLEISPDRLQEVLTRSSDHTRSKEERPAEYVQLPEHRIWAPVIPGRPDEPLDGFFHHSTPEPGQQRVLAIFGMYFDRPGFTVVEVVGHRPRNLLRSDGSPLFSSRLPAAGAAGLFSLSGEEELLELGWRMGELPPAGS